MLDTKILGSLFYLTLCDSNVLFNFINSKLLNIRSTHAFRNIQSKRDYKTNEPTAHLISIEDDSSHTFKA